MEDAVHLAIEVDEPDKVYSPGDHVKGRLVMNLTHKIKITGLKLEFAGSADVFFSYFAASSQHHAQNFEQYFKIERYFIGDAQHAVLTNISEGVHEYPFSFTIPHEHFPCSYIGDHAKVMYKLRGTLHTKSESPDHMTEIFISVNTSLDLTEFPEKLKPVTLNFDPPIPSCCCFKRLFCSDDKIEVTVSFLKTAYTRGEIMTPTITVKNKSHYVITLLAVSLILDTSITANTGKRRSYSEVVEHDEKQCHIGRGEEDTSTPEIELLPQMYPTNLGGGTEFIELNYTFQVELELSGIGEQIVCGSIPIVIA